VPACRYHLSHAEVATAETRYCYLGPAFRFPDELLSPQEFNQAGLEWFGGVDAVADEARVVKLTISALEATGLSKLKTTIGDLGLFNALLDDMAMPARWRRRLRHQFWRPQAFHTLLENFAKPARFKRTSISPHVDAIIDRDATTAVSEILANNNFPQVTDRTLEDVASRLSEKLADRSEPPLSPDMVEKIESYLKIHGALTDVVKSLKALAVTPLFSAALHSFEQRIAALEDQGLNPKRFHFNANFGRELEYYTGLVFQVEVDNRNAPLAVAGGGRYDSLLQDLGATQPISAVGCAIHTERVKAVMS
jgi:ATP phosphoribosyltransferase regulatory subunit